MWPQILLDLLPHFARLIPAADKYLASRGTNDKAHEAALAALAGEVRGQAGQVTETQAAMRRQLQEQGAQIAEMAVDVTRARMGVQSVEERLARLEKTVTVTAWLACGAVALGATVLALLVVRMAR